MATMTGRPNRQKRKHPKGLPSDLYDKRQELNLTQEQAAHRVGVSVRTWSRYERGKKPSRLAKRLLRLFLDGKI